MKTIQSIIVAIMLFVVTNTAAYSKNTAATLQNDTVVYTMPMHGAHCEMRIMKNIPYEKGVSKVKVDTKKQIATVIYKQNKTDKQSLVKAFNKLGYDAREVNDTTSVDKVHKH